LSPAARRYARILHGWVEATGMESSAYGTHSMRRTRVAQIYRKTGNFRVVQLLLGHTKIESTVRYLAIEVDDALTLSEQVEL
jgi:site-specific recombinase XerD